VDTRLRKLESGDYDAIILAAAGLNRLGKTQRVREVISADVMTPAAGQGALGIEIRNGDSATRALLAFLDDAASRAATTCERRCSINSAALPGSHRAFAEVKNGAFI